LLLIMLLILVLFLWNQAENIMASLFD